MKRAFTILLAMSVMLLCEVAFAENDQLDIRDEWYMISFYSREYADEEIKSELNDDGTYSIEIEDGQEIIRSVAYGLGRDYYVLECEIDEEQLFIICRRDEVKAKSGWVMYNNSSDSKTCVFTNDRMVLHGSSMEYVLSDTKLCLIMDDDYEEGSIEVLSDNAFLWSTVVEYTINSSTYQNNMYIMFVRSSFFET